MIVWRISHALSLIANQFLKTPIIKVPLKSISQDARCQFLTLSNSDKLPIYKQNRKQPRVMWKLQVMSSFRIWLAFVPLLISSQKETEIIWAWNLWWGHQGLNVVSYNFCVNGSNYICQRHSLLGLHWDCWHHLLLVLLHICFPFYKHDEVSVCLGIKMFLFWDKKATYKWAWKVFCCSTRG